MGFDCPFGWIEQQQQRVDEATRELQQSKPHLIIGWETRGHTEEGGCAYYAVNPKKWSTQKAPIFTSLRRCLEWALHNEPEEGGGGER